MSRVAGHLFRCFAILVGYLAACLAASAFLSLLLFGEHSFVPGAGGINADWSLLLPTIVVALFIGNAAFIPAAVAILLTELAGWRDWLVYALAGGAIGLAVRTIMQLWHIDELPPVDARVLAATVACGMVGGLAYWLIAGRSAGEWLHGRPSAPERSES